MADRFPAFQNAYLALLKNSLDRWDHALSDVRRRRYSPQSLLSDMLGYWLDVASFSTFAVEASDMPPRINLTVAPNQATALAATSVDEDPGTQLETLDLLRNDGAAGLIPRDKVRASLFDDGKVLVVQLVDLDKIPGGLQPGEYSREVTDATTHDPIALIAVAVQ